MQDRFKFRVYSKEQKRMFYQFESANDLGLDEMSPLSVLEYYDEDDDYELMQCTGLKDKNGKLIYEGDIVKIENCGDKHFEVYFFEEQGMYRLKGCAWNAFQTIRKDCLEVIGNIYENPELLNADT